MNLLVDTNIAIDCLQNREPFAASARKLFCLGYLKEMSLWMSVSQFTDAIYVLSDGGRPSLMGETRRQMKSLLKSVHLCPLNEEDAKAVLDSTWEDLEDAFVYRAALKVNADAIITRNQQDFQKSFIKVLDCEEFFVWLEAEKGLVYEEIPW